MERGKIEVEDAPFVVVEMDWSGNGLDQVLTFRTNVDEVVSAGLEHPLRLSHGLGIGEPKPYLRIRPAPAATPLRRELIAPYIMSLRRWRSPIRCAAA